MAALRAVLPAPVASKPDADGALPPWPDRPVLNVLTAAALLACSPAQVYALAGAGKLVLVKLAGRTSVRTDGVAKLIREAEPWTPSGRNRAALTERHRRVSARLAS